ncbi:hypothetical protein ACH5RR_027156 [Cinchona calisaya]|uniref:Uncharacterized protein n=1 Tax=Cinchona calisaya TaxID=153742 RepID=A0ABD2Z4N2_9GENT
MLEGRIVNRKDLDGRIEGKKISSDVPYCPGLECSGYIIAAGKHVAEVWKPYDKVLLDRAKNVDPDVIDSVRKDVLPDFVNGFLKSYPGKIYPLSRANERLTSTWSVRPLLGCLYPSYHHWPQDSIVMLTLGDANAPMLKTLEQGERRLRGEKKSSTNSSSLPFCCIGLGLVKSSLVSGDKAQLKLSTVSPDLYLILYSIRWKGNDHLLGSRKKAFRQKYGSQKWHIPPKVWLSEMAYLKIGKSIGELSKQLRGDRNNRLKLRAEVLSDGQMAIATFNAADEDNDVDCKKAVARAYSSEEFAELISAISASAISLHSYASSVAVFNGLNFSKWCEQVEFHLGVLDLDLALLKDKPAAIIDSSSEEDKLYYKAWDRATRMKQHTSPIETSKTKGTHQLPPGGQTTGGIPTVDGSTSVSPWPEKQHHSVGKDHATE